MAIVQALRADGHDPYFYDIDGLRPSFEEVEKFFRDYQPDVVGISAVVSTAYAYTKNLARMIRRVAPATRIVVGGNLAASAEILHRLASIDVCVVGEGEIVISNLMKAFAAGASRMDPARLDQVKGISYLRPDGEMVFTGYELRLPADAVFNPDFEILDKYSRISNFINDPFERPDFSCDPRSQQPHRRGKKMVTLVTAKGCVARCTFCHRWDKGYRTIPVTQIIEYVKLLMERYNVGFITFTDENFGSDRRQTLELICALKPLDILWQVGGVRVRTVDLELLKAMKDTGCVAVYYGMETGSPTILEIMEKKATLQDNLNAAKWTQEAGIFTIFQMVLAMPGESPETIQETTKFLKTVTQNLPESPRSRMSLNYIQALPGTPVYEYARQKGLIGKSLADEEAYLVTISDVDAADDTKMLNFTDYDYLTVRSWRREIVLEVMKHYREHNRMQAPSLLAFAWDALKKKVFNGQSQSEEDFHEAARVKVINDYSKGGYFNLQRDLAYDAIVAYAYPLRKAILSAWLLQDEFRHLKLHDFLKDVGAWLRRRLAETPRPSVPSVSLRLTVAHHTPKPATPTETSMAPLRDGR